MTCIISPIDNRNESFTLLKWWKSQNRIFKTSHISYLGWDIFQTRTVFIFSMSKFLYVKVLLHWMNAGWCDREHRHRYLPDHQQQEAERRHQQHQSLPGQPLHGGPPLPPPLPSHGALARDWHQDLHHGSHLQDAQLPRDSHRARQRQQPHGRELSDVCQFNIDDNPEKIIQNFFSTALEGKGRQTLDSLIFRASKLLITFSF